MINVVWFRIVIILIRSYVTFNFKYIHVVIEEVQWNRFYLSILKYFMIKTKPVLKNTFLQHYGFKDGLNGSQVITRTSSGLTHGRTVCNDKEINHSDIVEKLWKSWNQSNYFFLIWWSKIKHCGTQGNSLSTQGFLLASVIVPIEQSDCRGISVIVEWWLKWDTSLLYHGTKPRAITLQTPSSLCEYPSLMYYQHRTS